MKSTKSKKHKLFRRSLAGLALMSVPVLAPQSAYAVGEQNGKISGVVTDKLSGSPLPGARLEIKGKNLIGGPQALLTADDGSYEFIAVPPGPYDVTLTFEGVKPLRRKIIVRQGETFPLNIAWTVEETKQEVKVIYEERRMTRPDTTHTGTVLSADQQARVATTRNYQNITQQVAGVTGGGNPNIKGAMNAHNRYLVDGLDITDPVTNTFSANMNFDSIESFDVMTGGTEAEYNSLGGVINLTTSGGTNEWHVDSSLYVNHQSLSAGNQFGPQLYDGVRPFAVLNKAPNSDYQVNLNLSGPIIKNKWVFHASYQYGRGERSIVIGPPFGNLSIQHPPRLFTSHYFRIKTLITPTPKHRISISISTDPATIDNVNQLNTLLAVAEDRQNQGGAFGIIQWDYFISDKVNTNLQTGVQYQFLDFGPQGRLGTVDFSGYANNPDIGDASKVYEADRPQHVNNTDGTIWYQGGGIQLDKRLTFQFNPSVTVRGKLLGSHEAKFGLQVRTVRHNFEYELPGGRAYSDDGGPALENGLCLEEKGQTTGCFQRTNQDPYTNVQVGTSVGLFVRDRWKVTSWLRINPGLRFDYGRTTNSLGEVVSNLWGFGPRLGLVFDLTQDQKTIFTAYYGRSNEVMSLLAAAYADVTSVATTYQWNPDAGTGRFDRLFESGGPGGYQLQPNAKAPHTDEVTLSLRREAFNNSVFGVDYTYKRVGDIWDSKEINQIWDPTGVRVNSYVNGQPQQIFLYTTFAENWRVYQGVDFLFEARPRQEWDFAVIYTLSWLYGPGGEQFAQISGAQNRAQFYNPRFTNFYDGYLPEDRRHQLKIRASYTAKGLSVGAFMTYQSGTALTKRFFSQNDGDYTVRRSPTGTEPQAANDVTQIAELRLPAYLEVNARVSYDLTSLFTQKFHLTLIADMFNMFNLDVANTGSNATNIEVRDVPTYGQIRARQTPLRFQLGLRIQY